MATQFKSYAKTDISDSSGSPTILINSSQITAGKYGVLIGVLFSNTSPATRYVTIQLAKNGGDTVKLAASLSLPPNTSFELMEGNKLVMEPGDVINCYTDAATSVDIVASVMINDA